MSKDEALSILIANAVCIDSKLHCDDDCPYYKANGNCKYLRKEMQLEEAVETIKKDICVYRQINEDWNTWECSSCAEEWCFESGSPKDNAVNYCPRCGKKVINCIEITNEEEEE